MKNSETDSKIDSKDDYLHQPGDTPEWRESYYFNWVDLEKKISGFTTLGILPNKNKRELVFILFYQNKMEIYYREPDIVVKEEDFQNLMKDKKLTYELVKPLNKWNIQYNSRKMDVIINFKKRHPLHYFGKDSSASWHQHFEASGDINGELKLKDGTSKKIEGYGQRDKSWGFRDWHLFDKWFAGHFQFEEWSVGFRKDYYNDRSQLSGYVTDGINTIPIKMMDIEVFYDKDKLKSPLETIYSFTDEKNQTYKIKAERITPNSYMRFMREFEEGFTELFEQMSKMEDLNSGEIGSGLSEQLRTTHIK
ncbi:MAG: hypothetical protein EU521_01045 [Promethearchaeota archaeon]|nr:MAG: hypothetical protein EU521_01045 [Candidatus Lokiarchaeota archaeon]